MKKLLSGIASIAGGALIYIFMALPVMASDLISANGYKMIVLDSGNTSLTFYGLGAIIALIVAGLLIAAGVLALLNALKVIKFKQINLISFILSIVLLVAVVIALICAFIYVGQFSGVGVAVGLYLVTAVAIATFVLNLLFRKAE